MLIYWHPAILFTAIFSSVYVLSIMRLSTQIEEFYWLTHFTILIGLFSFILGTIIINRKHTYTLNVINSINKNYLYISYLVFLFSILLLIYEYSISGIPILSDNPELARFAVQQSGYIHILALLFKPILSIYILLILTFNKIGINKKDKFFVSILSLIGILLLLASGSRGQIALVATVSIISYLIINKIKIKYIVFLALVMILLLGFVKYYRDYLFYGDAYISSIADVWYFGEDFIYLYNGYVTLTMNFQIFNQLVVTFLSQDYFYGYFLLMPIISLYPGRQQTLGDFQNEYWDTGFHGGLTSTYLGVPYADFGIIGVIIISLLLGMISKYLYVKMLTSFSFRHILIYSYWIVTIFLCIYTYPYGEFNFFLYFVVFWFMSNILTTYYKREI